MKHSHGARGFTVGSLLGQSQLPPVAVVRGAAGIPRAHGVPTPPPALTGKGCCRSGCFGCPWADAARRRGEPFGAT